jgi:hypothetical protein
MTSWGDKTQKKTPFVMQPATKKARTIRFTEVKGPWCTMFTCCECGDWLPCTFPGDGVRWMSIHTDIFHQEKPVSTRKPRRKVLPLMAERTTPEEYRKLKKQARRARRFRGVKDKGEGASLVWM